MNSQTRIFNFIFAIVVFALTFTGLGIVLSYQIHNWDNVQQYTQGWSDGYNYIKPIEDLQRQVGAEPDSIWGRETNSLYEKALCEQYAQYGFNPKIRKFDKAMLAKVGAK